MSILRDVRDYLKQHQRASLNDLAHHFGTSPDAMRGMLDQWINKGRIRHCPAAACTSCATSCTSAPGDSYEWVSEAEIS